MDLPGLGQFYCVACARYFIDELSLNVHFKSKVHRRRLKELKEPAYTQEDAEAAAGMSTTLTSRSNAAGASGSGTTSTAASSSAPAPTATSMDA
ncbi:hypothetical protein CAOG_06321 [Capsaspora owczarzaki ATCC 30864]|uniref:C2H2-type domain-containing protein n=1 Tax=Capsaspora owczarzaki (strain ATCC 30864) TaxID=595528 RepID=A0A0D2VWH4_CAPO3|nr:hypothetical protein CAOG_06321 [Capsaspora owczarzaki ATCC 30864]KJE95932.1 hypothetical protein CAOG_006321 [Capsaspora owczarzaki ATCC 30864]|eukprot:XP_004345070.1 hypothetical protein CAOG_06321 [Capsaspora owczarzaki ATCC 30864]